MTDEPLVREYDMPLSWLSEQLDKIAKANAKAAKAGIEGQYTHETVPRTDTWKDEHGTEHSRDMVTVRIYGDVLKKPGYTFAATIDWSLSTPLIRRSPALPEEYVVTAPETKKCDYCGTERDRKDTYLVIEDATGKLTQIGRSCLAAYCGINPGWVSLSEDGVAQATGMRAHEYLEWTPVGIVELTHIICEIEGQYTPRKAASGTHEATTNLVWKVIGRDESEQPMKGEQERLREQVKAAYTAGTRTKAEEIIAWAASLDPGDNDFLYNLNTIAKADHIGSRHIGMAVAMNVAYDRELIKIREKAERKNEPVPTGKAITFEGVIEKMMEKENEFGVQTKMWIRLSNDSRIYSTVPQTLFTAASLAGIKRTWDRDYDGGYDYEQFIGVRISLRADVEASRDDPTTGFAKRPRTPKINEGKVTE